MTKIISSQLRKRERLNFSLGKVWIIYAAKSESKILAKFLSPSDLKKQLIRFEHVFKVIEILNH